MFAYWLLFVLYAFPALVQRSANWRSRASITGLSALAMVTTLIIGLRYEVGADYHAYELIFKEASSGGVSEALSGVDPGYQLINWLAGQLGGGTWMVNLVCGGIFAWGLTRLCRQEPSPLLAALIAVPYLVVVVAMGYSRQAVAIGVVMAGLAALLRGGSLLRFALFVAVATLFHRTAVIVLPFAIFSGQRNHFVNVVGLLAIGIGLYFALLAETVGSLYANYVEQRYASQGATIRVAMNLIPAMIVLAYGPRLGLNNFQLRLWRMFAFASLAMIPLLLILPSTTAVDRVALYLLPLQIIAFGRASLLFKPEALGRMVIVFYSFAVLFIWLNYAAHARFWIPYRTIWSSASTD